MLCYASAKEVNKYLAALLVDRTFTGVYEVDRQMKVFFLVSPLSNPCPPVTSLAFPPSFIHLIYFIGTYFKYSQGIKKEVNKSRSLFFKYR